MTAYCEDERYRGRDSRGITELTEAGTECAAAAVLLRPRQQRLLLWVTYPSFAAVAAEVVPKPARPSGGARGRLGGCSPPLRPWFP